MSFWHTLPAPFFVLAPMEGVTDVVFRHVVAKAGRPDLFMTEFVNTDSYCSPAGQHSTFSRLLTTPDEQPIVAQIWGTNPEYFAIMAKDMAARGYQGIDINMGCPARDITKRGACAALIQTPTLAAEIIAATKQGGLPVSVKTRIGYRQPQTEAWLSFLLQQDIAALTVHGRTVKEMSKVPAHWDEIAKAVALRNTIAPQTRIIGNGDVADRAEGMQRIAATGVDGVMIGRGVFHNVFCFEQTPRDHSPGEYLQLLNHHLDLFERTWPAGTKTFNPLKRFFKIYIRDFSGATELRKKLMESSTIDEVRALISK